MHESKTEKTKKPKTQQTKINILSKWDEYKTNNTNKGI